MSNEISNNFFLILELDPDAAWDQALFERRLREKQNQWSRDSQGFTTKAKLAKKRLELLSEMKRVLSDPEQRKRLAREARAERVAQQNTRGEEFTRRLQLMERKGFLEQSEVTGLLAEFHDILDERALQARISVEIRTPAEQDTTQMLLEPVVLADINVHLALINKKDLYHLLDLPPSSSHEELYQAAERLYNEMIRRQPKTSLVEIQTVLAGHAQTQFKTAEARQRYDNSIRHQVLADIFKDIDAAIRHSSEKKVYFQQVEDFVERAERAGWAREVALQELQTYAHEHGWTVQARAEVQEPVVVEQDVANEQAPEIIRELQIEQTNTPQGCEIRICWPAREEQVLILKSSQALPLAAGVTLPVSALDRYGEVLQGKQECAQDFGTKPGSVFYTAAIVRGERAYIGSPQRHLYLPEIYNLRFQNTNSGLRLTWLWPAECNEARLFYSTEHWPQPAQDNRQFITIARSEYEALGHYILRGTTQQNYYLIVALLVRHEGQQTLTHGTGLYVPLASKKDITYEIKNPRFGYKQRTLHIYSQVPCQLPTLLFFTRQGSLPARKTEGTLLQRVEGPVDVQHEQVIVLPDTKFPSHTFGKLFLEDDRLYAEVTIHQPEERKLRLS